MPKCLLRSLVSDTDVVADIVIDPSRIVGSGSFLCLRQLLRNHGNAQYDMFTWFSSDESPVAWRRLLRRTRVSGGDLTGQGWVTEFACSSHPVVASPDEVYRIRCLLRELTDLSAPSELPPL